MPTPLSCDHSPLSCNHSPLSSDLSLLTTPLSCDHSSPSCDHSLSPVTTPSPHVPPQGKKRQYDQELENLERKQKQTIERLEQDHTNRLRDEARRIKADQDKELSKFQNMMKNRKKEVRSRPSPTLVGSLHGLDWDIERAVVVLGVAQQVESTHLRSKAYFCVEW